MTQDPEPQAAVTQAPVTQDPEPQAAVTQDPVTQDPVTQDPVTSETPAATGEAARVTRAAPERGEGSEGAETGRWGLARAFAWLLVPRDARWLALFRIAAFASLLVHFLPSLLRFDDHYGSAAVRRAMYSRALHEALKALPDPALRGLMGLTLLACVCGLVGYKTRRSAALSFAGLYALACLNSLPVVTLALQASWNALALLSLFPGADRVYAWDAWRRRARGGQVEGLASHVEPPVMHLLPNLLAFQMLQVFFFAGIEKLYWDFGPRNEMQLIFNTPRSFIVRDWVWPLPIWQSAGFTALLSWGTIACELALPVLIAWKRTRMWALCAYQVMFLSIVATLAIPPLFYVLFTLAPMLLLTRGDTDALWHHRRRWPRWRRTGQSSG